MAGSNAETDSLLVSRYRKTFHRGKKVRKGIRDLRWAKDNRRVKGNRSEIRLISTYEENRGGE